MAGGEDRVVTVGDHKVFVSLTLYSSAHTRDLRGTSGRRLDLDVRF